MHGLHPIDWQHKSYSNVRCGVYAVYCHTENEKIDWKRKTFCKWVSETKNSSDSIKRKAIWKIQHISNGSLAIVIPFSVRFMFYGFCFLFSSVSYMLQINHIESVFMLLNFCHSSSVFFTLFLKNITLTVLFSFTYNSDLNSYATWVSSFGFVTCIVVFAIFIFFYLIRLSETWKISLRTVFICKMHDVLFLSSSV